MKGEIDKGRERQTNKERERDRLGERQIKRERERQFGKEKERGGCHSCVVSSGPTILRPRVQIPSTPSVLFSICIEIVMRKE